MRNEGDLSLHILLYLYFNSPIKDYSYLVPLKKRVKCLNWVSLENLGGGETWGRLTKYNIYVGMFFKILKYLKHCLWTSFFTEVTIRNIVTISTGIF